MNRPIFWSYSHEDDEAESGLIVKLCEGVQKRYKLDYGETVKIFLDKNNLPWGEDWQANLETALDEAIFFIPVVTPNYLRSVNCVLELKSFISKADEIGVTELVMPLIYVNTPGISDDTEVEYDLVGAETTQILKKLQFERWEASFEDLGSGAYRKALHQLAKKIHNANINIDKAIAERQKRSPKEDGTAAQQNGSDAEEVIAPDFLESMATIEEKIKPMPEQIEKINVNITEIGDVISKSAAPMNNAVKQNKGIAFIQVIVKQLSSHLDKSANDLLANCEEFYGNIQGMHREVKEVLAFKKKNPSSMDDPDEFCTSFVSLASNAEGSREGVQSMLDSMVQVEGFSNDLNRPLKIIKKGLVKYLEATDMILEWGQLAEQKVS